MIRLARAVWSAPRAVPPPPRRVWRDWALLALIVVIAVIESLVRTDLPHPVIGAIVVIAIAPTVLWRRTYPLLMLVIALVTSTALQLIAPGAEMHTSAFAILLIYALYRWAPGREQVIGSVILLVGLLPQLLRSPRFDDLVGGAAVLLSAAALGLYLRARAAANLRQQQRIRLLEREHLARDLHDTVAHHVSAIAIRSQAGLAMAGRDAGAAADALRLIETEAQKALRELRSMVRVLRDDDAADLVPSPRLDGITQLAGTRPGGVAVSVRIDGDDAALPAPVSAAVFRLAQESITNALRHARGATRVDVVVSVDDAGVSLKVTNDGEVAALPTPGFGIIGMMERAAILGGTCQAVPMSDGGFSVTVVLPRAGWAA